MTNDGDRPKSKISTLGGAYPIDVMLHDIANSEDGPYQAGVFVGIDKNGDARITFSLKQGMLELSFLSQVLQAFITNELNGVG